MVGVEAGWFAAEVGGGAVDVAAVVVAGGGGPLEDTGVGLAEVEEAGGLELVVAFAGGGEVVKRPRFDAAPV